MLIDIVKTMRLIGSVLGGNQQIWNGIRISLKSTTDSAQGFSNAISRTSALSATGVVARYVLNWVCTSSVELPSLQFYYSETQK